MAYHISYISESKIWECFLDNFIIYYIACKQMIIRIICCGWSYYNFSHNLSFLLLIKQHKVDHVKIYVYVNKFLNNLAFNQIENCVLLNRMSNFLLYEDNNGIQEMKICFLLKSPVAILAVITWVLKYSQIKRVPLHKPSEEFLNCVVV